MSEILLPELKRSTVQIKIVGDSPLIVHHWSEKAKKEMLDKQMKRPKQGREAKDPFQDYADSMYWITPQPPAAKLTPKAVESATFGFPTVAFKAAAVRAATDAGLKMTDARRAFHIDGEIATIEGTPSMREDMVRNAPGTADIRYRGQFENWSVVLTINYNSTAMSLEQIVNLFEIAGFGVGVGEWRPEKSGSNGRFHVSRGE